LPDSIIQKSDLQIVLDAVQDMKIKIEALSAKQALLETPVYYFKAPVKEDFKDEAEYNKAVTAFEALKKELTPPTPDSITKAPIPPNPADAGNREKIDYAKLFEVADKALSMRDMLNQVK